MPAPCSRSILKLALRALSRSDAAASGAGNREQLEPLQSALPAVAAGAQPLPDRSAVEG